MEHRDLDIWIQEANRQQEEWYKMIKDKKQISDSEVDIFHKKKDGLFLMKKIGYTMFGPPTTLPSYENMYTGYNKDQLEGIEYILKNILSVSDGDYVKMSYILLVIKAQEESPNAGQERVFTIYKDENHSVSMFVDRHSRIYSTWMDFQENNLLPKCIYCCPQNGHYGTTLKIQYLMSPACSIKHVAVNKLDKVASVVSVATLGALVVGAAVTLTPVVATATTVGTCGVGIYSTVRGVTSLFDRKTHGQSISVTNQEARQSWISIGTSVLAGAGGAVLSKIQRVTSSGGEISRTTLRTMKTLNTANVVVNGVSSIDTLLYCKKKYDNCALTPLDVFSLSCEIMFFFNAISTVKATNKLISVLENSRVTPNSTVKLTKSMKRRLKKRRAAVNEKLQSAIQESDFNYSAVTCRILSEAAFAFVPNAETVMQTVHCLGYDLRSLREKKIKLTAFLINSFNNMKKLYMTFQNEIDETFSEIQKLFCSQEIYNAGMKYLSCASQTAEFYFKCVLLWVKLKFENCMLYVDKIISNLHKKKNGNNQETHELTDSSINSLDYLEPQEKVLKKINELIVHDHLTFNTLKEYIDTFDYTCSTIVQNLKDKLSDYEKHCKIFEEMNPENGVDMYNKTLGINGNPEEYFLNEIMNKYLNESMMANMKRLCLLKSSSFMVKNFDFWLNVEDECRFYYYIDKEANGCLPTKLQTLNIIYKVTNKNIVLESTEVIKNENGEDVVVILPKYNLWFKGIFMKCVLTNDNTNIYLIIIM